MKNYLCSNCFLENTCKDCPFADTMFKKIECSDLDKSNCKNCPSTYDASIRKLEFEDMVALAKENCESLPLAEELTVIPV